MATAVALTCAQTPLAWPSTVQLSDLPVCNGCAIKIDSPHAGSLQVTTRRAGDGVGDGVSVDEARNSVAVDYRGQRYTLMEAIFHTPGQHVFPGQSDVYPAEYCLHFQTFAAPQRKLTLVIPVSHQISGPGADYFAAIRAQPDPAATRPTLLSLFGSPMIDTVQFLAPELRGRTSEQPAPSDSCDSTAMENMIAFVLQPCQIRATDLERIPREGSLSSDPRDLPVQPRLKPTDAVSCVQLLSVAVLGRPGIQVAGPVLGTPTPTPPPQAELECYPLQVKNGRDVIMSDVSGIPIETVLGLQRVDVSGERGLVGAVRDLILGDPNASSDAETARKQILTSSLTGLTSFFFSVFLWFALRQALFNNVDPNLQTLSWVGICVVLVATGVGVAATPRLV